MYEEPRQPRRQATGHRDDTRQRILAIARDLFASQGFTETTIVDIADRLGTTTAALYYHFKSKADILDTLLAEPLAAYTRLAEPAELSQLSQEQILSAYLDFIRDTRELVPLIAADHPSLRKVLDARLPRRPEEMTAAIVTALASPHPGRAAVIRARAAIAVIKEGVPAALQAENQHLDPGDREEILAAAARALNR
jgi:AcrR family transcriptional regulator